LERIRQGTFLFNGMHLKYRATRRAHDISIGRCYTFTEKAELKRKII